jgi:hypothetical protein
LNVRTALRKDNTMTTTARDRDRHRLEFVIRLANADLDKQRSGDWMNLRDDLLTFLGLGERSLGMTAGPIQVVPLDPPFAHEYPEDDFRRLQGDVRKLLAGLADSHSPPGHLDVGATTYTITPVFVERLHLYATRLPIGGGFPAAKADVRGSALLLLWVLLAQDSESVRRCTECGLFFYRVRRQLYCSKKCVNRVNKRAVRRIAKTVPAPTASRKKPKRTRR